MNWMEPETRAVGGSRRRRASEVADFPEPDSPTRPRVSPGAMAKEMASTTGVGPKAMVSESTARRGGGIGIGVRLAEFREECAGLGKMCV